MLWQTMGTALVVCILAAATTAGAGAQQPPVQELIARAVSYVEAYEQQLSGLVAEEDYVQLIVGGPTRHLKSDFLLVRTTTLEPWRPFRDVYSVDGRSVRDRQERLERLFTAGDTLEARRLYEESSRYNLGDVQRNINVPSWLCCF